MEMLILMASIRYTNEINLLKDGRCGLGDNVNRNSPTLITGFNDIVFVAAGYFHSIILNSQGTMYAFGLNEVIP
jgi:alpha-tubulin suppressor-like RCC1 family protein